MNETLILGIETSGILCSIAWWQSGKILLEYNVEKRNAHATLIAKLVEEGVENLGISFDDLDLVAVASGPGSFTGLRIGMAYAKGICLALDIPLIPVSNFEVLAYSERDSGRPVLCLIEARKDYYYAGSFENGFLNPVEQYISEKHEILEKVATGTKIVVHEEINKGLFAAAAKDKYTIQQQDYSAEVICNLGYLKYLENETYLLDEIEPLYLQPFAGVL